jgi:NADH-quinone oxidoreductase subunit N
MNQMISQLTFSDVWAVMGPEIVLVLAGFVILLFDLFAAKESSRRISPYLGLISVLVALVLVIRNFGVVADVETPLQLSNMLYVLDNFGNVFKVIFLTGAALTLLMSIDFLGRHSDVKVGEYTYLLMFATVGAMAMASAYDLITLFVGLELLSISSYILVAIRRDNAKSSESAMKYLITGALATALALYGMSFIYGVTGQTNLFLGRQMISQMWIELKPVLMLGFLLMFAGFAIKAALAPFHKWAPDTYEGAPNPITSFLAVVSKAAVFALIARVFIWGFSWQIPDLYIYLAVLAASSMVIGNVAALAQKNIKRLLALSSVAQAGYLLVPLAVLGKGTSDFNIWLALGQVAFYLFGYLFMTMGAFAVLTAVTREAGTESIEAFRGLYKRSPFQAVAMTIFLLSMAGMPLTAGFFGKFFIFLGTINTGMYWLGALLFFTSAIAFYYYFGVMRNIFANDEKAVAKGSVAMPWSLNVIVLIGLIGTIGLGVFPNMFLDVFNGFGAKWFI